MEHKKVIFIAGPISGVRYYRAKFEKCEKLLIENGFTVLSPARLPKGMTGAQYERICLAMIDAADAVVLLPGWYDSRGAKLEADYCGYIGKPTYFTIDGLIEAEEVRT